MILRRGMLIARNFDRIAYVQWRPHGFAADSPYVA
jgi:hypothetical protein